MLSILLLPLLGVSCFTPASGGIWYSPDAGQTWEQRSLISFQGRAGTLASSDILDLVQSFENPDLLFAATQDRGIFKTEDRGVTWFPVTTSGRVQTIDISSMDDLTVVAARDDQIFLTSDGGESWKLIYTNPSTASISDIAFDRRNEGSIMAALTNGTLIRSDNFGTTWQNVYTFEHPVLKLIPTGTIIYALTTLSIHSSSDYGRNWKTLEMPVKSSTYVYSNTVLLNDLIAHANDPDQLLLLGRDGLYRSLNGGNNWSKLNLLLDDSRLLPLVLGMDPQNPSIIYYANQAVLYKSDNAGQSWQTIPFPRTLVPRTLLIHPKTPQELFLGAITL